MNEPLVSMSPPASEKVRSLESLAAQLARERRAGRRVALTNGCFDLLHAGHRHSLEAARAQGDLLVVALNSDASVRRLKGPGRPAQDQQWRAAALAALDCVDYVVIFEADTADGVLAALRPEVLVKGADYRDKVLPERALVESYGGKVVLVDLLPGISTTRILKGQEHPPGR